MMNQRARRGGGVRSRGGARAGAWTAAAALVLAAGGFLAGALGGCAASHKSEEPAGASIVGTWVARDVQGLTFTPDERRPDMTVGADGRVHGFAGVNRYATTLDMGALSDGEFRVSPIAATKMAGPPEAMRVEMKFLEALSAARRAGVKGQTLTLWDERGQRLTFTRQDERGGE